MADMSMEKLEQELCRTEALLQEQTGTTTCLLRPPGGKRCQTVTQGAAAHGLSLITWSVDPKDWATNDRDKVVQRVLDRVCDGDIILMHDMSDSSVDAALAIIDRLEEAGYRFVTVSELDVYKRQILELQEKKSALMEVIAGGEGQSILSMSKEELLSLLG